MGAAMVTDLERARAHLRVCQESLRQWRTAGFDSDYLRANIGFEEDNFLAALEWVWAEQQRYGPPVCRAIAAAELVRGLDD